MTFETKYDALFAAVKDLRDAERASLKASVGRANLPPGSSRARVTTANARWTQAAEERDRCLDRLHLLLMRWS